MFSYEYYQISENIYFEERLPTTASGIGIKGEISKKWIKKKSAFNILAFWQNIYSLCTDVFLEGGLVSSTLPKAGTAYYQYQHILSRLIDLTGPKFDLC